MRLFIAINFTEGTKNVIQDIIKEVKTSSIQGRFVAREHIHLTVEFLGEVPEERIGSIKDVIDTVMKNPFSITLSRIGYFKGREGNIYWIGLKENNQLMEVHAKLHDLLIREGFKLDNRPYKPHITLGRKIKINLNYSQQINKTAPIACIC